MRRITWAILTISAIAGCGRGSPPASNPVSKAPAAAAPTAGWQSVSAGEAASLIYADEQGKPLVRATCAAREARLLVNVSRFAPIASEERMSFGANGAVITLVADTGGDKHLGGVTGQSPIPAELKRLLIAPISASYGAQSAGPFPRVPDGIAGPFLGACNKFQERARAEAKVPKPGTSACLVQDGRLLETASVKAVGTEPFWAARIEGRCVTYSTPDDQAGTRIWTAMKSGPMGPVWTGAFQGRPFVLRMQPAVRCSDGMSDKDYDLEVALSVSGEERRGCAEREPGK